MSLSFKEAPKIMYPNTLLYGPPKTRKTTGACSMPGGLLLMNLDLPNASHYARSTDPDGRIMEIDFKGMESLIDVVLALEAQGEGPERVVESVVVDTVGDLHRRLLEGESNRAIRPTLNQYGDVAVHIERFCRRLCELPVNVCIVCHEYPVKDETTGGMERLPWTGTTNPSLGSKLMSMVDIVGFTGVVRQDDGRAVYRTQLISEHGRRGGERFAGVLGEFPETDLGQWIETIHAHTQVPKPKPTAVPKAKKSTPQEVVA